MGKTSLKPYGGARDRPGRWQSRPRRAQKGPARRGKRARGVDTAEREKGRLEATCHPRNVAHVGRSMRSAYVGGWGSCSRSQVERFCLLVKSRYTVHVAHPVMSGLRDHGNGPARRVVTAYGFILAPFVKNSYLPGGGRMPGASIRKDRGLCASGADISPKPQHSP